MATIELNRRRVLSAILIIGLAAAGAGAGTIAFFSDTETSTNNVIQAGTLDLSGASDAKFGMNNTVPGTWHNGTITTNYTGSVDAEVDVNFTLAEPSGEPGSDSQDLSAEEFASYIKVTNATVNVGGTTTDLTSQVSKHKGNTNDWKDLEDFRAAAPFDNVTGTHVSDGEDVEIYLDLYFVESAGNDAQADGVNVTVAMTAEQPGAD